MGLTKLQRRTRIKMRIRKTISGTNERPRLSVFRSNKEIYAQLIDDVSGITLISVSSRDKSIDSNGSKSDVSKNVGKAISEMAQSKGISTCSFDRNGFLYHGRIKVLAESAREAGLKF